jgi:hypothetical protein
MEGRRCEYKARLFLCRCKSFQINMYLRERTKDVENYPFEQICEWASEGLSGGWDNNLPKDWADFKVAGDTNTSLHPPRMGTYHVI